MTIYLYKKTHNKTGLKYLGKTNNRYPNTYRGSGHYWKRHIAVHGYDVTTEILLETDDPEKIKEMGLYYSDLWDIVNERDENGKKTWANERPEMGDGGAQTREIIKRTAEKNRGQKRTPEQNEAKSKRQRGSKKSEQWLEKRVGMKYNRRDDTVWEKYKGVNHWNSDLTIYTFQNVKTGQKVSMIRSDFRKLINDTGHLSKMINGNPKYKTVKGWRLIKD